MKRPRISIITPSFNQGDFLEETIDSVLSCGYENLEYMIFDGGSTDQSVEIIKKYEHHLSHWESRSDSGQSHAINKGLEMATGHVINWLNSDDFYEPDALQQVGTVFEDPSVTCLCARSNIIQEDGSVISSEGTDIYDGNLAKTIGWARIDQPETFFSQSSVNKMGKLEEGLHFVMDRAWWIRFLLSCGLEGVRQSDERIVNFRLHGRSKTTVEKEGFFRESAVLYAALARSINREEEEQLLLGFAEDDTERVLADFQGDHLIVSKAINYHLLYLADHFYYTSRTEKASACLQLIRPELLDKADANLLKKLRFRNRFPSWLMSMLRNG